MEYKSFYNNELLAGIAIVSVLQNIKDLEISKALLIQPILSHSSILNFVKKTTTQIRSIEELIAKKNLEFTNFNRRYYESIELSINSILLMKQLGFLDIKEDKLICGKIAFNPPNERLGERATSIIKGAKRISEIISREEASSLYLSLRVEL